MSMRQERERPLLFDPDSPEYIKDLQRPAVIKEDLSEMERRKRVQQVLESKGFLKELENVIKNESEVARSEPEHLKLQYKLSELTTPHRALSYNSIHNIGLPPIPIADLNNNENVSKQERVLRNKMACFCRLADMFQWVQGFLNHLSYRIPSENEEILINPFGLLFHEVSASSIIKVKPNGDVIDPGNSRLGVSQNILNLHSTIHASRPGTSCILQLHSALVAAVASMNCGLLRLCPEALNLGTVNCYDSAGNLDEEEEIHSITKCLGEENVVLLRNRGFIAVGETVEEVLYIAQNLITACETQLRAAKAGITNLIQTDEEVARKHHRTRNGVAGLRSPIKPASFQSKTFEIEWEAWMRFLDHQGLRTGHLYKQPQLKPRCQFTQSMYVTSDVAVPPAACSVGALDESDHESIIAHKLAILRREQERSRWLNSPNAYQKIEILETNTDCPKRITKWVQDATSQSANGTPVKIVSAHQFSPMSTNPKEFKERQQKIKENRLSGKTSAGPQSVILDASTYEDLRDIKPDNDGITGPADRSVLIGTASKGIINRHQQHNAQVYRQLYAPNPFSAETDEDIKKYMKEVEMKSPNSKSPMSTLNLVDTRAETASPVDDYPSADVASLMQGVRLQRNADASHHTSASVDDLQTGDTSISIAINVDSGRDSTFDSTRACSNELELDYLKPRATSTPKGESDETKRSRLDRGTKKTFISSDTSAATNVTMSEDEAPLSGGKKKKKKGFFSSFLKRKDRSSAA